MEAALVALCVPDLPAARSRTQKMPRPQSQILPSSSFNPTGTTNNKQHGPKLDKEVVVFLGLSSLICSSPTEHPFPSDETLLRCYSWWEQAGTADNVRAMQLGTILALPVNNTLVLRWYSPVQAFYGIRFSQQLFFTTQKSWIRWTALGREKKF